MATKKASRTTRTSGKAQKAKAQKKPAAKKAAPKRASSTGGTGSKKKAPAKKSAAKKAPKKVVKTARGKQSATKGKAGNRMKAAQPKKNAPKKGGKPATPSKKAKPQATATRKAAQASTPATRGKAGSAKREQAGKRKGPPLSSSVAPGRKFVKRSGAVLAQPRTPKASIRTPAGAEELKARIGALSKAVSEIRSLKRSLVDSFWSVGEALAAVDVDRLYEVKGYVSLDSFIDRELGMSKRIGASLRLMPELLQRPAAESAGLDRSVAAVEALVGKANGERRGSSADS